jgi:hypothetical protein
LRVLVNNAGEEGRESTRKLTENVDTFSRDLRDKLVRVVETVCE